MPTRSEDILQVADDVRAVYRADTGNGVHMIEVFLAECWKEATLQQKVDNLDQLLAYFQKGQMTASHQESSPVVLEDLVRGVRQRYQEGGEQVVESIERYLLDAFFCEDAAGKVARMQQIIDCIEESLRPKAPPAKEIGESIRQMACEPLINLASQIEEYLNHAYTGLDQPGKIAALEQLIEDISQDGAARLPASSGGDGVMFARLVRLLLGPRVEQTDLCDQETADKLAEALNAVFDVMGELMRTVQLTLLGESRDIRTLRTIIGAGLDSSQEERSLRDSLDKVKQAFLVCHKSFRDAASATMSAALDELSPDNAPTNGSSWLKISVVRKAQLFNECQERFDRVKAWYESGRFDKELLAEFEKNCRKRFK